MRNYDLRQLDPWVASSLLQKAIRRGEPEIACQAADAYRRHRGKGIWRRLISIVCEDVGIAAPDLVAQVVWLSTDPALRSAVGEDSQIIHDLCRRLSAAPKDRSTDYLYCAAISLPEAQQLRANLAVNNFKEQVSIAVDQSQSLLRRAVAVILAGSFSGSGIEPVGKLVLQTLLEPLLAELAEDFGLAISTAAQKLQHPFVLMLPILMTSLRDDQQRSEIVPQLTPFLAKYRGLPLCAFDKHTHVGKQAITRFSRESRSLRDLLARHADPARMQDVAHMAAYYADAMPVSLRLDWGQSRPLETIGCEADMIAAGCPVSAIEPIIDCVRQNLDQLNDHRSEILARRKSA